MDWNWKPLESSTGATLACYEAMPKGAAKAIIQINHGMAEHAARYSRFAKILVKAGYGVVAHDHRGHGYTTAPDASLGRFAKSDGWTVVLEDVRSVHNHLATQYKETPRVIFGHSMGSIITLNAALRFPELFAGIACWNAGVDTGALALIYGTLLRAERMFKGSDVPSGFATKLTFEAWNKEFTPNRTDFDWLSRDEAEVDKYVDDPLCGFPVTIGLWLDVLKGISYGADDHNLEILPKALPVHLQGGAMDPCSEKGQAVRNIATRMEKLGATDVTLNILPDTRHESLNENNRDQTTADFVKWLDVKFG